MIDLRNAFNGELEVYQWPSAPPCQQNASSTILVRPLLLHRFLLCSLCPLIHRNEDRFPDEASHPQSTFFTTVPKWQKRPVLPFWHHTIESRDFHVTAGEELFLIETSTATIQ